jgi:2-polyprenyl-3-methyl-5-hydroxy-6-metoxy-1,4-benzoquinol methylase
MVLLSISLAPRPSAQYFYCIILVKFMKKRHNYEYKLDTDGPSAPAAVVRMVGRGKRVLEIGAGPGSITRVLKDCSGCHVTAIELDEEAIKKLSPYCEHVYRYDLNDQNWTSVLAQNGKFEVVVAADVLEHLYDPWATLAAVKRVLDSDGEVVVSLPHIGHNAVIACLLQEDFQYQDWGLLDKTHIQFFDIENIQRLFNDTGFKIIEAEFIVLPPEQTELAYFWRRIPEELKLGLASKRFGMVYQVVVKAMLDFSQKQGLRLASLPVPVPTSAIFNQGALSRKLVRSIRRNIIPYVHPRIWLRLRNFLYWLGLGF